MNVKKAKLASDILGDVVEFFKAPEYANRTDKIKEYAWWAVRGDGPGYHAQPTPLVCKVPPKDEGYIVSQLILPIHACLLAFVLNSSRNQMDFFKRGSWRQQRRSISISQINQFSSLKFVRRILPKHCTH